jgi:hypothetical protein
MPSLGMTYFEILISNQNKFSITTDTTNFVLQMKVKGCYENKIFNEYQKKMNEISLNRTELLKRLELEQSEEVKSELSTKINMLNSERINYIEK